MANSETKFEIDMAVVSKPGSEGSPGHVRQAVKPGNTCRVLATVPHPESRLNAKHPVLRSQVACPLSGQIVTASDYRVAIASRAVLWATHFYFHVFATFYCNRGEGLCSQPSFMRLKTKMYLL